MGLRDDLQADIAEAFDDEDGLADAVKLFECSKTVQSGEYDVDTGTYPEVEVTMYRGRGVFGDYSAQEADGTSILITDTALIVLANELVDTDGEPATPSEGDKITGDGLTYTIKRVAKDPADATWELTLRAS